jgi:hypothetical protein
MPYIATIDILLDVDTETDAADAISEIMRPIMRQNNAASCLVDWCYTQDMPDFANLIRAEPLPPDFHPDNTWPDIV